MAPQLAQGQFWMKANARQVKRENWTHEHFDQTPARRHLGVTLCAMLCGADDFAGKLAISGSTRE